MASFKIGLCLLVSVLAFHVLPSPVLCGDEEQNLLHDINRYRQLLNLPVLMEHKKASCLAVEIANDLEDKPCEESRHLYPVPGSNPKNIPNFQKNIDECKININTTREAVIMPACVPKLDPDALFLNYTKSLRFTKFLNNSKYTVAGLGSEDDWMVLILSTNTSSGDFSSASAASLLAKPHCLRLTFFLTVLLLLIN